MRGVPLARQNLLQDQRRAALAVIGIGAAFVLVLVLDGIFAGAMNQVTAFIRRSPADVFVAQQDVRTMHMTASAPPTETLDQVRAVPGVAGRTGFATRPAPSTPATTACSPMFPARHHDRPRRAPTGHAWSASRVDLTTAPERQLPALRAHHLGFIFQDFNLLAALTALENVEIACNLAGTKGKDARWRATELLDRVGLNDRVGFRPDQLSGGEKQRVAIARSLANKPTVVLADEPTANLDSSRGRDIPRLLRQLAQEQRCSIVMVSHDERLKKIADRTLWLEDGAFRQLDTMAIDPVCSMAVQPADDTPHYEHAGTVHWFCSAACRDEFAHRS